MLRFCLRPRTLALTVLMLLAVALCLALGSWQWGRAHSRVTSPLTVPTVALSALSTPSQDFGAAALGRSVRATGSYLPGGQRFVSDRSLAGRPGYWVLTPLRTGGAVIPVVRGWVAAPSGPATVVPSGTVTVVGRLQPSEDAAASPTAATVRPANVIDRIVTSELVASITEPLHPGYLVLERQTPASAPALSPVPLGQLRLPTGGVRIQNSIYAVQWVVFAGFVVFVWFRFLREDWRERDRADVAGDPASGSAVPGA